LFFQTVCLVVVSQRLQVCCLAGQVPPPLGSLVPDLPGLLFQSEALGRTAGRTQSDDVGKFLLRSRLEALGRRRSSVGTEVVFPQLARLPPEALRLIDLLVRDIFRKVLEAELEALRLLQLAEALEVGELGETLVGGGPAHQDRHRAGVPSPDLRQRL